MGLKRCREGGEISNITATADYFMLLSGRQQTETHSASRVFECKTCNRRFESFQALGGHRASHKKPRLIEEDKDSKTRILQLKPKTHECSICGLEFAIGQALGGHMRRHRNMIREDTRTRKKSFVCLDLNLTPYENDLKLQIGRMFPNELAPPLVNYIM